MKFSSFERGWRLPSAALLVGAALLLGPACGGAGSQGPGAEEPSAADDRGDGAGNDIDSGEGAASGGGSVASSNVPAPPSGAPAAPPQTISETPKCPLRPLKSWGVP